jgi:hypothetical protein
MRSISSKVFFLREVRRLVVTCVLVDDLDTGHAESMRDNVNGRHPNKT